MIASGAKPRAISRSPVGDWHEVERVGCEESMDFVERIVIIYVEACCRPGRLADDTLVLLVEKAERKPA